MIAPSLVSHLYDLIETTLNKEASIIEKFTELEFGYGTLLKHLLKGEHQFFPDNFSRSEFIIDHYQLPKPLSTQVRNLGYLFSQAKKRREVSTADLGKAAKLFSNFIDFFASDDLPTPEFSRDLPEEIIFQTNGSIERLPRQNIECLTIDVLEVNEKQQVTNSDREFFILVGMSEEHGKVKVYLWNEFIYLQPLIWQYARIKITNVNIDSDIISPSEMLTVYSTSKESLVVLDTDFLFDASALARCHVRVGSNAIIHLANKFTVTPTNYYFMRGAVVNEYLDEKIAGNEISTVQLFNNYIASNPTYALLFTETHKEKLIEDVKPHYATLNREFIPNYSNKELNTEPTFLSDKYGIRGRLDVLVKYEENLDRQDIIELKTSKDELKYGKPIRPTDCTQAVSYNLLLSSINEEQTGSSSILYSSASIPNPSIRNVPNDVRTKQAVLQLRNTCAYYEYLLTKHADQAINLIDLVNFQHNQLWDNERETILNIRQALNAATELQRQYFYVFAGFTAREHRAAKIGASNQKGDDGFAALWYQSRMEKENNYSILAFLQFQEVSGEGKERRVSFRSTEATVKISKFRIGDFILLYAQEESGDLAPTKQQIIKATIKEIDKEHVVVSPMNRHLDEHFFQKHSYWAIESELFELGYDAMYQSLFQFLSADDRKKRLLLGLEPPQFTSSPEIQVPNFKPKQLELLNQALSAKDYFLLQGPPGTGKTKYMLRELVNQILSASEEKILLLAYTNRAVDEICEALKSIDPLPDFYRLGYSDSTEHADSLLSRQISGRSLAEIRTAIMDCRIFVSTVLTLQRNPELTAKIKFNTAIVDEASQLLEPQIIGVLCQVNRFILIGDEKQLPAVVLQDERSLKVQHRELNEIGIRNLGTSLFERLLQRCIDEEWGHAHGMLIDQGRMHEDIQALPSRLFYEEQLKVINQIQREKTSPYLLGVDNPLVKILKEQRAIFLSTKAEKGSKQNLDEVKRVEWAIKHLWPCFENLPEEEKRQAIGVITPFRAQVAAIKSKLPDELQDYITVDTVERYQGGQRRIIIISFAVNNAFQLEQIQVLNEDKKLDKKLNVALTRAKDYIILIGCKNVLSCSPIHQELIDDYYRRKAAYKFQPKTKAKAM